MTNFELTVLTAAIMGLCGNVPRDPKHAGDNEKAVLDCAEALIREMRHRQAEYDRRFMGT